MMSGDVASRHIPGQMDLNEATEQELARVPNIGALRARKVVEYRQVHGRFENVDELTNVEGFGHTLTDDLRVALTAR